MELLDIAGVAGRANLPESLTRYYRDRFILFVPAIRVGKVLFHPPEAVDVVKTINQLAARGNSATEIEDFLQRVFPVCVITSRDIDQAADALGAQHALQTIASALDERGARIEAEVAALRSQIERRGTGPLAVRPMTDPPAPAPVATELLLAGLEEIHAKIGTLASREQLEWIGDVVSAALPATPAVRSDARHGEMLAQVLEALDRPLPDDQPLREEVARLSASVAKSAEQTQQLERQLRALVTAEHALAETERSAADDLRRELSSLHETLKARDAELMKGFRGLVLAVRAELAELRSAVGELSERNVRTEPEPTRAAAWQPIVVNGHGPVAAQAIERAQADPGADGRNGRAPRRMGQPIRPSESAPGDEATPVVEETGT